MNEAGNLLCVLFNHKVQSAVNNVSFTCLNNAENCCPVDNNKIMKHHLYTGNWSFSQASLWRIAPLNLYKILRSFTRDELKQWHGTAHLSSRGCLRTNVYNYACLVTLTLPTSLVTPVDKFWGGHYSDSKLASSLVVSSGYPLIFVKPGSCTITNGLSSYRRQRRLVLSKPGTDWY